MTGPIGGRNGALRILNGGTGLSDYSGGSAMPFGADRRDGRAVRREADGSGRVDKERHSRSAFGQAGIVVM
jgi:hypothetical protein